MSRILCSVCSRPEKSCICAYISAVNNQVLVVILQHPNEVKQSKGTVTLLSKSLMQCQVIVGEDFTDNDELNNIISEYHTLLLYPSEQSQEISYNMGNQVGTTKPICLILLDGTWKKAYRMFMLSKNLQQLMQVSLPLNIESLYKIRKTSKENALSTLEACCYALAMLENNKQSVNYLPQQYHQLLQSFVAFNQFHLSFRPTTNN